LGVTTIVGWVLAAFGGASALAVGAVDCGGVCIFGVGFFSTRVSVGFGAVDIAASGMGGSAIGVDFSAGSVFSG
jgi:N-methylhydantoinase B/oxoprolinase/acetone carboxylase alpha subunit